MLAGKLVHAPFRHCAGALLTFELSCDRRCAALAARPMINDTVSRPRRHAAGRQLERVVRHARDRKRARCAQKHLESRRLASSRARRASGSGRRAAESSREALKAVPDNLGRRLKQTTPRARACKCAAGVLRRVGRLQILA